MFNNDLVRTQDMLQELSTPENMKKFAKEYKAIWGKEENNILPYDVEKVFIQDKSVTVLLRNGKKGNSICSSDDTFDPYVGFTIAYYRAKQSKSFRLKQALKGCVENAKKKGYKQAILNNN